MYSRAWWGLLSIGIVAIFATLLIWKWQPNPIGNSTASSPTPPEERGAVRAEELTIPRNSASVSAQEQYRKALEADDARRVPTWEDINRDRPAEF